MTLFFSHKRAKTNSRSLDRLYRSRLSNYRKEPTHTFASSSVEKAVKAAAPSKTGAVIASHKIALFIAVACLIGGAIAWQELRTASQKTPPLPQKEQTLSIDSDSAEKTCLCASPQADDAAKIPIADTRSIASTKSSERTFNPAVLTQSFESGKSDETIAVAEVKDFSNPPVTFLENNVFKGEQEKISSMDSIKNFGLAALMVLAMDTAALSQIDTSAGQAPNRTETVTFAQENPNWQKQFKRHEFTLGIGDPAMVNFHRNRTGTTSIYYPEVWLQNQVCLGNVYTTCPITVGYRFRVLKWLWVGGDVSYCGFFGSFMEPYTNQKVGDYRDHFISIMPAVRFSYLNREHVTLYSGLAGGIALEYCKTYPDYKAHNNHLALQCTLFGVSAGSQRWFGFAELGWGFKGYANAGFGFRFNAKRN